MSDKAKWRDALELRRRNEALEAEVARLREALDDVQRRYQVTHCHSAARAALNPENTK